MSAGWLMRMNEETREKKKRKEEKKEEEQAAEEAGAGLILTYLAQQLVIFLLRAIFFQNCPHNNIFAQFFFLLSLFNTSVSFIAPNFEELLSSQGSSLISPINITSCVVYIPLWRPNKGSKSIDLFCYIFIQVLDFFSIFAFPRLKESSFAFFNIGRVLNNFDIWTLLLANTSYSF